MWTFIYFHGFNSKGDPGSSKLKTLSKLGKVVTIDYNSFDSYDDILRDLGKRFKDYLNKNPNDDIAIVGTSLGAFWASKFSDEYGFPGILINPSIKPAKTLQKHVGLSLKNYKTGEVNKLIETVPPTYPELSRKGMYLVLVDKGDDVIDPLETEKHFIFNEVIMFEGGSHRFEHMEGALPHIQKFLNNIETVHY
jgi:predicted esterase YcpF (UPF0227 family)